ncbi:IclR family transcriptional regulator [Halostagnicola sp. A-GB9-2]|uniref:IclR family transcriptional regulator n=1 Tax=Halostagnicola sp. A-GB9-2 TaxID=3048066 RepID=UPI0024BFD34B|nr:IclR family transcriptional regulator [Halostagnicola sp. A-GB9-2]MDJ1434396.1 IclR family transcriptional regulator [Halostagnicola sp. A-GB9-2]
MSDESRRIQSVDRSFQILRQINETGCSSVSEISEDVGLSPGTVHTHLATLKSNGFVKQEGEKYKLGMEFIPFSERVRGQTDLFRAGKMEIEKLAHEYDAVAHLITEYQGKTLILYETFGKDAIGKEIHTKKRDEPQVHTHCTAGGKAILAHLPESGVEQIIEQQGLPAYTSHTITDEDELYEELDQIRDQRYAVNNQEVVYGNQGIGAPIIDEHETVIGAISISGPANNWQGEQLENELAKAVIRSANNIEINIHTGTGLL